MKQYKFSAILVNYNHSEHLPHSLNAALHQAVPFDEIIIIDDASTDNSVQVIEERISGISNTRLIRNPENLGIIPTVNIGLKEATGDFIYYMSSDDGYSLDILKWCKPILEKYPDVAMISGNTRIHNVDTGKERVFTLPFPQEVGVYSHDELSRLARKRNFTFYGGANLIRRDAIIEAGGYLESFKWHNDWFLYLLIASRKKFAVIPEEFICVRQTKDQYSNACYDWTKQREVIETFIRTLQQTYKDDYHFFRDSALLPTYDMQALLLLLGDKTLSHYLTPLLVWRLLTYKPLRAAGRLLPEKLRPKIRALLRV